MQTTINQQKQQHVRIKLQEVIITGKVSQNVVSNTMLHEVIIISEKPPPHDSRIDMLKKKVTTEIQYW